MTDDVLLNLTARALKAEQELERLQQENASLCADKVTAVRAVIKDFEASINAMTQEVVTVRRENEVLHADLEAARNVLFQKGLEMGALQERVAELEAELEAAPPG